MTLLTDEVAGVLEHGESIDITTTGRRSGEPRRIEIVYHNVGGRIYISGHPGRRAWLANLQADPAFVFHLKHEVQADLPATARIVTDPDEREGVLAPIARLWQVDLGLMMRSAPLVEVSFD